MEITSVEFLIFVAVSLLLYWKMPRKFQWIILLVDSLIFYFANVTWYTFIYVIVSVCTVYYATTYFKNTNEIVGCENRRKRILLFTIVVNIGILATLKYTNLFINTFNWMDNRLLNIGGISKVQWLAPLAISYYTLQMVSYLLDCYWGVSEPYESPFQLLLYCIYFPLMTSGPICRMNHIGKSLFEEHRFDYDRVKFGLYRIAWGLIKKLAISNRIAVIVDQMWDAPETSTGINVWIALFMFVIQLYTDFSGCMDIALGVSECFGITLPENFRAPFFSKSVQEIWRRWHITLGEWLKDYIMYPISHSKPFNKMSRKLKKKYGRSGQKVPYYFAMLAVWLLMGLWHGNSWKYIIGEGLWFWLVIVSGEILSPVFKKCIRLMKINTDNLLWKAFQVLRTFALFSVGNLFFRATSLTDALMRIYNGVHIKINIEFLYDIRSGVKFSGMGGYFGLGLMGISLLTLVLVDYLIYKGIDVRGKIAGRKWYIRWAIYYMLVILIILSMDITSQESLYAQF